MTRLHSVSLLLHLIALAMWLGGIAFFLIVFGPAVHELKAGLGLRLLNRGRSTFEVTVVDSDRAVISYRDTEPGPAQPNDAALTWDEYYLTILSVKLLLFVAMLVHHALQVFKYGPKIAAQ